MIFNNIIFGRMLAVGPDMTPIQSFALRTSAISALEVCLEASTAFLG